MKNRRFGIFLWCLLTGVSAIAQTEVSTYRPGVTTEGITYFLPTTVLHFTVTCEKHTYQPGEYARYTERYLRLPNMGTVATTEWVVTSISVQSYGVANAANAYSVKLKRNTVAPLVTLAGDGRLLAINTDAPAEEALSQPGMTPDPAVRPNPADYKTPEMLAAGSTAKMAELAAEEIYDIRENRSLLNKGQADYMPADGEQLRLMLQNLDTQEEALMQLFQGTTTTDTYTFTVDYTPAGETNRAVLFRFSKEAGFLDANDLQGAPYYISVTDLRTLPQATETEAKKKESEEVRYCVPGNAQITLFTPSTQLLTATFPLAQFGRVETLSSDLFNKKLTTAVLFSPATGGITKIDN